MNGRLTVTFVLSARVTLRCAHPGKFTSAVSEALGDRPPSEWMPEGDRAHPAVAAILALELEDRGGASDLAKRAPGVHRFRKGQDWTKQLREVLT